MALPEVTEGTHFNLPSFKVRGKGFVGLQKGHTHAIVSVDQGRARTAAAAAPAVCEEVWRNGRIFVGVRVDLAEIGGEKLQELIEHAWRNKAPKSVVAAHDEGR